VFKNITDIFFGGIGIQSSVLEHIKNSNWLLTEIRQQPAEIKTKSKSIKETVVEKYESVATDLWTEICNETGF
jgi:hypothetical protein